jgi:MscS family membrane protein
MEFIGNAFRYISETSLFDITLRQYVLAFLAILMALVLRRLIFSTLLRTIRRWTRRTASALDDKLIDAVEKPIEFALLIAGLYAACVILRLPREPVDIRTFAFAVLRVLVIIDITWLLLRITDAFSDYLSTLAQKTESRLDDQLIPLLRKAAKIFIAILATVFIIQNLGYSVASLLAGLGIGGLAIALAAQETLSNFFGSITILTDRPFTVGDWIETEGQEGVVEEIGFRSTRLRTFAKSQISIPNSVLAKSAVNNWSRMPIRRVKMVVGVTYQSTAEQMDQAVEGIRKLLREHPEVYQQFFLVYFTDFSASSLDILVYYFSNTTVWAEYLAVRQDVNIRIMRLIESLGMEIAYPTRTLFLKSDTGADTEPWVKT